MAIVLAIEPDRRQAAHLTAIADVLVRQGAYTVAEGLYQSGRDRMTLSGGDLTEAITLKRVGPPTPRPESTPIPPDPDTDK